MCRGTSGLGVLLTILVFLTVQSVSSGKRRRGPECPNCSGKYIKILNATTGKCVNCWPCSECNHGSGSSVPCRSTVTQGTEIHCLQCVLGANFSDSSGIGQCQPCGACSGKHDRVLSKCNLESDVKCDCEAGFYRNQTIEECLPSVGSGEIKSLFTLLPTSSLVTSSYSHVTATPLLPGITSSAPVPSRTQEIRVTSMSASGRIKHEMTPTGLVHVIDQYVQKTMNTDNTHGSSKMKPGMIAIIVVLSVGYLLICGAWCLYRLYKKSRRFTCQVNNDSRNQVYRFSTLSKQAVLDDNEQGRPLFNEESDSRKRSGVSELDAHKISGEKIDSVPDSEDMGRTVDSDCQDGRIEIKTSSDQPDTRTEALQMEIPSSLEGEPRKSITKGQQCSDFLEADQDKSAIVPISVDGTIVPSVNLESPRVLTNKMPSANTFNVLLTFNPQNIQQTSSDSSQIQSGTGIHMANQEIEAWGLTVQPTEENRGYSTHIMCVPLPVIQDICMLLDIERLTDEKDYRMLGSELGLTPFQIRSLKQKCIMSSTCNSPSYVLLMQVFSAMPNSGTLAHLIPILKKMGRHDVINVINKWVSSQNCTQVAQAYLE